MPIHPKYMHISSHCCSLQAVDSDLVSNVTYHIKTESARQLFSLNPVTGELAVLQTLDFEDLAAMGMGASYTFQVEAVDQGGVMPPGQSTVTVRITVRASGHLAHHILSLVSFHPSSQSLREGSSGSEWG